LQEQVVKCETWPNCDDEPITYTAQLFGEWSGSEADGEFLPGAFVFNTSNDPDDDGIVDVTEVAEGDLRSEESLKMNVPGDVDLEKTWDQVFDACAALLKPAGSVDYIEVASADWSIEKAGGVRVVLRDIRLKLKDTTEDVLVRVQLIGNEYDFFDSYLPEGPEDEREYLLNQFDIMGTTPHGVLTPGMYSVWGCPHYIEMVQ
jgi:hypothetical protein